MPGLTPFWISIRAAAISMTIVAVLGIFISKWLYRREGSRVKLLESLLILSVVLPSTVLGLILSIIFSPRGPISQLFMNVLHLSIVLVLTGAVMASVIVSFLLMYQHTAQGFRGMDTEMINTARTTGVGEAKISLRLILSLARRSILASIMMSFAHALGESGATLMVAEYVPNETNTLPLEIYFLVEQGKEDEVRLRVLALAILSIVVISTANLLSKDKYKEVN